MATVSMGGDMALQVRMMRRAISPRFAMRIFLNGGDGGADGDGVDGSWDDDDDDCGTRSGNVVEYGRRLFKVKKLGEFVQVAEELVLVLLFVGETIDVGEAIDDDDVNVDSEDEHVVL